MLKSRNDEEQVQRAFAKALEMQHMAEENVTALKAELARTEHKNLEEIEALAEQDNSKREQLQQALETQSFELKELEKRVKAEEAGRRKALKETLRSEHDEILALAKSDRDELRSNLTRREAELQQIVKERNDAEAAVANALEEQAMADRTSKSLSQTASVLQEKLGAATAEQTRLLDQLNSMKQGARESRQRVQELIDKEQAMEQIALLEGKQLAALKIEMKTALQESSALADDQLSKAQSLYSERL